MCTELVKKGTDAHIGKLREKLECIPWTDSVNFHVALVDTGGLPGWVIELGKITCKDSVIRKSSLVKTLQT